MNRLKYLKGLLQENPEDPFLYFAIAKEFENLGQIIEAIENYEFLVENHPDYIGTYYHLGQLYVERGNTDKALSIYDMGITKAIEGKDMHGASELEAAKEILLG